MRVDFYGLAFEAPKVSYHLWSPWRASSLEQRMFDAVRAIPRLEAEPGPDEWRVQIRDPKIWRTAVQAVERVLKGWQEEADTGSERRSWRWLVEGDADADGYDHTGEPTSLWGILRVTVERGGPEELEKEEIDLEGFGLRIWGGEVVR